MFHARKTAIVLLVCLLLAAAPGFAGQAAGAGGLPLARAFTGLFQLRDLMTRLEACFLSAGLPERPEHVNALRRNLLTAAPLEQICTLYALAVMTRNPEDVDAFLEAFPSEPVLFYQLMDAERSLSATLNTGMADFLLLLAYEPATRNKAAPHLLRIAYNIPFEFMHRYYEDPVIMAYMVEHLGEYYLLESEDVIYFDRSNDCENMVVEMMASGDSESRLAAILMLRRIFDTEAVSDAREKIRVDLALSDVLLVKTIDLGHLAEEFPLGEEKITSLFALEASLYRPPLNGLAGTLYSISEPQPDALELEALQAILRYGSPYLERYEEAAIRRRVQAGPAQP